MKNKPVFSVIIPAYNEEKLLPVCLKSALNQDFPENKYEVIVVNNASTDKTPEIAKKFKKVRLVFEPKRGLTMARNRGLIKSRGKIIIQLDADCIVPENWLKKISTWFIKNKNLVLLTGPSVPGKNSKNKVDYISNTINHVFYKIFKKPLGYWGGNTAIKKDAFLKIGGYNITNPFHDEFSLLYKLNKFGKAVFDPNLKVISSNRRIKGRVLKYFFWEFLILYGLNNFINKFTKKTWKQWEIIR